MVTQGVRNEQSAAISYDILITGGHVVDPGAGISGRFDVGIVGNRIISVMPDLSHSGALQIIDASGQIVTPGLIDLHTHIYWGVTYWGIQADPVAARSGVTTWVDAGSAGAYSFPGFRQYIAEATRARTYCLLNISAIGLIAPTWELSNIDYCDVELATAMIEANRDLILGVKVRIDQHTTRGTGIGPLIRARALADRVDLPLMVHIGNGPPSLFEIAAYMRPGDILTHCYTGGNHRIVDDAGRLYATIQSLRERGLILDLGHGTGSFSFDVAETLLAQAILPDVISSDMHQLSVQGPMFDLPTTMSKFINLGLSIADVVERTTARPAAVMGRPDLGTLRPGSVADVALFRLEAGEFTFYDVLMQPRQGHSRLVNTLTLVDGQPLPHVLERTPAPWATLPPYQVQ